MVLVGFRFNPWKRMDCTERRPLVVNPPMKRELLYFLKYVLGVMGVLLCLYAVAYTLTVRRIVSPCGPEVTSNGVTQRMSVVATLGGRVGYLLFAPANRFDRLYIR